MDKDILKQLREMNGLNENDSSMDNKFELMSPNEVLEKILCWQGHSGEEADKWIKDLVLSIYGVNLDKISRRQQVNWTAFKMEQLCVHCATEEAAKDFLNECKKVGIGFISDKADTRWSYHEENTCYQIWDGLLFYDDITYQKNSDKGIIEWRI